MINGCPGAAAIKGAPTIKVKTCPECGDQIEIFSCDVQTPCDKCGFVAYNDSQSCLTWCKYARECVGDELYERFINQREAARLAAEAEKANAKSIISAACE